MKRELSAGMARDGVGFDPGSDIDIVVDHGAGVDTRFTTTANSVDELLRVVNIDDIVDVGALLTHALARPVWVFEVGDDAGEKPGLVVIFPDDDEPLGARFAFPVSVVGLARGCAEVADQLGSNGEDGETADDALDVAALDDADLLAVLQDALVQVRIFTMMDDDEGDPATLPDDEQAPDDLLRAAATQSAEPIRLLSRAGTSFAILPVPSLAHLDSPETHVVDIELLSPDRLVRYLGRALAGESLTRLAAALMQAAQDPFPEQSVPTFQDDRAGLAVGVNQSTPFAVTLEVRVVTDLDDEIPDQDGLALDVPRAALIDAAHAIEGWLA